MAPAFRTSLDFVRSLPHQIDKHKAWDLTLKEMYRGLPACFLLSSFAFVIPSSRIPELAQIESELNSIAGTVHPLALWPCLDVKIEKQGRSHAAGTHLNVCLVFNSQTDDALSRRKATMNVRHYLESQGICSSRNFWEKKWRSQEAVHAYSSFNPACLDSLDRRVLFSQCAAYALKGLRLVQATPFNQGLLSYMAGVLEDETFVDALIGRHDDLLRKGRRDAYFKNLRYKQ